MKRAMKGCLVVPQDEAWVALQQPLQPPGSGGSPPSAIDFRRGVSRDAHRRGERLAASRVTRDNLMHQMEAIVLQEAELGSALELLDYTRQKCSQQHDEIARRLEDCEAMLQHLERGASDQPEAGAVESLLNEAERVRWRQTRDMVTTVLPEVLVRLEDNIELNNAKIRDVRAKMEELRAKRLALREDIAVKEEDIALMLSRDSIC